MGNDDSNEALLYLLKAKSAFEEDIEPNKLHISIVYLNLIDLYNYQKREVDEARKYIVLAKEVINKAFLDQPLLFLEYYLALLVKSGDNYSTSHEFEKAKDEYQLALNITEEFRTAHNLCPASTVTTVYFNYAVYLAIIGDVEESLKYIDKAIAPFLTYDDFEHDKNLNLTKLFVFKADIVTDKILKKEYLEKSQFYILKCNDSNFSKVWKFKVENALQNFA